MYKRQAENNAEWDTLLFALGSLWQNGVSISWDSFYTHEDRQRIPLPLYPFERQRFWVDPAAVTTKVQGQLADSGLVSSSIAAPVELLSSPAQPENSTSAPSMASRKDRIASRVVDLLIAVSGRDRSQISASPTFMEQGFDSLSLTQVAFAIRREFSVKVSFSQLMNQLPNIDMLSEHLDAAIPAGLFADAPANKTGYSGILKSALSPVTKISTATASLNDVVAGQAETITHLVSLLKEAGVSIPASLANATALAEAALVRTQLKEAPEMRRSTAPIVLEAESTIPQRGILASSSLSRNLSASYNESITVRFKGDISIEKMTRAVERLVDRHDALRAGFDEAGRMMKIDPDLRILLPVTDLSAIRSSINGLGGQEEILREIILQETALPFPLPKGPLFRCQMVQLDLDCAALILTAHHVICDGWSLDVLIHDLCAFYSEEVSGIPASLEPAQSFLDYVQDVTQRQRSDEFKRASKYWHERFSEGFPVLVLPADHSVGGRREFKARRTDHPVPASVMLDLKSFAAKHGCSFFAALLSSLAILFARVSRQRRFVIALPTAEQPVSGQPGLVGHCVNLLPFAVELREGESVSGFLKRVQLDLIAAQEHAVYTMVSLLEDLRPLANTRGFSPISAGFTNVRKFRSDELPKTGFTVDYEANPKSDESFEFYLNAVETDQALDLHCHCDAKLFEDVTIREWLAMLDSIFRDFAADPSRDVLSLAGIDAGADSPSTETLYCRIFDKEVAHQAVGGRSILGFEAPTNHSSFDEPSARSEPELIRALITLWQHVLDIREIGPDDEFFALGGHSIAAAQLFNLIQRELGYSTPLSVLYDASTPRLLAKVLIRGTRAEDWNALVPIRRHGDRTPLFLVHAAEGNVLLYRSLAAHLGDDQPVFGLQSAGLDGRSLVDARFEYVARHYVREIRRIQAHGPYMLGGYCLGGTIALEMAQQLIEAGETVGLVALIEDYNVRAIRWPLSWRHRLINRFFLNPYFHLHNALAAEGAGKFDFFLEKLRVEIRRSTISIRGAWEGLRHRLRPAGTSDIPRPKLADIYEDALTRYNVRPYPGELTLFIAERHLAGFGVHLGGWGEIALGGVRLHSLPLSPRGSLIEPYVRQLASSLRRCLDLAMHKSGIASEDPFADSTNLSEPQHSSEVEVHT